MFCKPKPTPKQQETVVHKGRFRTPIASINTPNDLQKFLQSNTYHNYIDFIVKLNDSVEGKTISHECPQSKVVDKIVEVLERVKGWTDKFPPIEQPMRFGNKAFRSWFAHLEEEAPKLMAELISLVREEFNLPAEIEDADIELAAYFRDSFGNSTRIDYGTGHETTFAAWLFCLNKLGAFKKEDYTAVVLRVFQSYLLTMRHIQRLYMLEPAGSHGVWSLDDYQFLPFLWGSAQVLGQKEFTPKAIVNRQLSASLSDDFMFFAAIEYIHVCKTGPFEEHSSVLTSISNVPYWEKVNVGMLKMYKAEVLSKFPVMQHFRFGSIISADW